MGANSRSASSPELDLVVVVTAGYYQDYSPQAFQVQPVELGFGFGPLPPLRRTWFINEDGRNLIQVQQDRFIFNWKKAADDDKYPSYDDVIDRFNRHLAGFVEFLNNEGIGTPTYRQFELIYVNHIPLGKAEEFEIAEGRVLVDHMRDTSRERFLEDPEAVNWVSIYSLPNQEGRLYVAAQSARSPDGRRILRLDMTARGIPRELSDTGRQAWFNQAHVWITHGFADLTTKDLQERVWKRTAYECGRNLGQGNPGRCSSWSVGAGVGSARAALASTGAISGSRARPPADHRRLGPEPLNAEQRRDLLEIVDSPQPPLSPRPDQNPPWFPSLMAFEHYDSERTHLFEQARFGGSFTGRNKVDARLARAIYPSGTTWFI
jgi:uncharacterized protein (TIGR04255 family)